MMLEEGSAHYKPELAALVQGESESAVDGAESAVAYTTKVARSNTLGKQRAKAGESATKNRTALRSAAKQKAKRKARTKKSAVESLFDDEEGACDEGEEEEEADEEES